MNKKYLGISILLITLSGCLTNKDKNACDGICQKYFATNYGNCESCTYSNILFYIRTPGYIKISEDTITSTGTDTTVMKTVRDTLNYWEVVPADTPFTLNLGNKMNFPLNKLITDSITACIDNIPGIVTYNKMTDTTILSWVAISKNGDKIFTGSVRANPKAECIPIEVNKK